MRAQSACALGSLKPLGAQEETALRKLLADPELYVRLCAILALGELGGSGAISDLEAAKKASKDESEHEREEVDDAIAKIQTARPLEPTVAAMVEAIHKFKGKTGGSHRK